MNQQPSPAQLARTADAAFLRKALLRTRERTLGLLSSYVAALGDDCSVPCRAELNPPLWELCHVAWFQDWWLSRNPQWAMGLACNPDHPRTESRLPNADARLNSSTIAHDTRWEIGLPDLQGTRSYLQAALDDTLTLLEKADEMCREHPEKSDQFLYFFRLSLLHEQMHNEAAVFMAKLLGILLPPEYAACVGTQVFEASVHLQVPPSEWMLGWKGSGFAFDNELPAHIIQIGAFEIDSQPVSWAQYLQFIQATGHAAPPFVAFVNGLWMNTGFGQPRHLNLHAAAENISWFDAQAYCQWAGRRLPSEAEWEYAAYTQPELRWGQVWEWTADTFLPFEGFEAHPYVDYSKPWFHDRKVLKGASWATAPEMVHPRYRNYFQPDRHDVLSGFRTCK